MIGEESDCEARVDDHEGYHGAHDETRLVTMVQPYSVLSAGPEGALVGQVIKIILIVFNVISKRRVDLFCFAIATQRTLFPQWFDRVRHNATSS